MAANAVVKLDSFAERLYTLELANRLSAFIPEPGHEFAEFTDEEKCHHHHDALRGFIGSITDEQLANMLAVPGNFSVRVAATMADSEVLLKDLELLTLWLSMTPAPGPLDQTRVQGYWSGVRRISREAKELAEIGRAFLEKDSDPQGVK